MPATTIKERTARSIRNEALGIRPTPSEHTVTLRLAEFNQLMAEFGCIRNVDVAHLLDLGEGTVARLRKSDSRSKPGPAVIAAFVKKFPKVPLRRVFDFGDDEMAAAA